MVTHAQPNDRVHQSLWGATIRIYPGILREQKATAPRAVSLTAHKSQHMHSVLSRDMIT